jgi:hypothetical protein
MTRLTRLCRAVGVGVAVIAATLSMTQVAHAEPAPPTLPPGAGNIAVAAGNQVFLVARVSRGVQIYKCDGKAWTFVRPEADLVGDNGQLIIKHGAGPIWTATDGSSVKGAVEERATVDPTAIPWLRLKAIEPKAGANGDRLAGTTFIQRVNTQGGLAPTDRCNGATSGAEKRVDYKADYFFYKATGGA